MSESLVLTHSPSSIDQGKQFESSFFKALSNCWKQQKPERTILLPMD